ncbi:hypothetical protein Droror1_Dr00001029 [Drosera rotundifolia]
MKYCGLPAFHYIISWYPLNIASVHFVDKQRTNLNLSFLPPPSLCLQTKNSVGGGGRGGIHTMASSQSTSNVANVGDIDVTSHRKNSMMTIDMATTNHNEVYFPNAGPQYSVHAVTMSNAYSWSIADRELKRKKRVASCRAYAAEGKVKASLRNGFRWVKNKYSQITHGY